MIPDVTVWIVADGFSALTLEPPAYKLLGQPDPLEGGREWRHSYADSPFVDGEVPVHSRKANQQGRLAVKVEADSQSALDAARDDLCDRLDSAEWELHVEVDGVERAWRCFAANYTTSQHDAGFFRVGDSVVRASFPVYPIRLETS